MRPSFNIAGPCYPDEHYMLPPQRRLDEVLELIEERRYLDTSVQRDLPELGPPAEELRDIEPTTTFLLRYLRDLAARSALPLVVIVDDADALMGESMASFLMQLRQGYLEQSSSRGARTSTRWSPGCASRG